MVGTHRVEEKLENVIQKAVIYEGPPNGEMQLRSRPWKCPLLMPSTLGTHHYTMDIVPVAPASSGQLLKFQNAKRKHLIG